MKLKILIVPILIVLIIIVAVWIISPSWKSLKTIQGELAKINSQVVDIQEKNNKAELLAKELNGSVEQQNVILAYIPADRQEEDIISNLNSLANDSGLAVFDISVITEKNSTQQNKVSVGKDIAPVGPTPVEFSVNLGVAGNYDQVKELLGKIVSLRRFNSISELNITKASEGAVNNLQADITLTFDYISKNNSIVSVDNEIFSNGSFDMSVVDEIKNKLSTAVNVLAVEPGGVANPFVK